MTEEIKHLEEKIAFLEHHVTGQDRVMLQFADDLARLKRELKAISGRLAGSALSGAVEPAADDERPPHY